MIGFHMTALSNRFEACLTDEHAGERLDRALALALPDLSRTRIQALMRAGKVHVNGVACLDPKRAVQAGDVVSVAVPPPEPALPQAEPIALDVVHEDGDLLVVNKPAGMVVHPGAGNFSGTLVNALLAHCKGSLSGIGGVERPGIVHRLDKDTSGLLVVAKNDHAHRHLQTQFADHGRTGALDRRYVALVWGVPSRPYNSVDAPIDRDPRNREKMRVCRPGHGREAVTHWQVLGQFGMGKTAVTLLECRLETGRTHQIRVHMAHIGHPLLGDATYGTAFATKARLLDGKARDALDRLGRQALHARSLAFEHPASGEVLEFDAPVPADMQALLDALRENA
jgi:23S rRNA pseudouridine1911/1915/1917 synthase